jgi:hypothetical protein
MVKKMVLVLICFISLIIFMSTLHGQGSKKTITLRNGEVVWDLNGEWDVLIESVYGGTTRDVFKITQQGSSFVAIRMMGNPYMPPGSEGARGELDKNGFKKVQIVSGMGLLDSKGQISDDGNKMVIDSIKRPDDVHEFTKVRQTYTRK